MNSIKPANLDQVTFPVLDLPELVSRAPAHIGQTFVKQALSYNSTMPAPTPVPASSKLNLGKEVVNIVRGLGIPCKDTDFYCPVQNDCPPSTHVYDTQDPEDSSDTESAIWNPEDDSDLESKPDTGPEPATSARPESSSEPVTCQLLVKLHNPAARLPTRATSGSAGYNLYSCEDTLIPPGTRKPVNTGISIAVPPGTQCSQWAGQAGLKLGRARPVLKLGRARPVLTMTSPGRPKFSGRQHHRPSLPG